MDLITIIIWIFMIYIFWVLIDSISSLQQEIREMRIKCIREVHNNDIAALDSGMTKDPKKNLMERFTYLLGSIKSMI